MITVKLVRARRGVLRRNQWRVLIVAGNHRTVFWSETYSNREDARRAFQVVSEAILSGQVDYVDIESKE